ncbi:MAG: murein biosynthesis integral membrane protein MurJ [Armatimonadota bacterium]
MTGIILAMQKASTVAKGAAIIAAGTFISRLLGWLRENLFLHTFGASDVAGAYNTAFGVPDLLYYLLAGGALSAAFIPVFSDFLTKKKQEDANRTGSSIGNLMLIALIIGVGLELIFAPYVVRFVAPGPDYAPGTSLFTLTVFLTRVMCSMVIFTAISGLLTGILNSHHHFLAPTIVWNTYNLGIILGITVFSKMAIFNGSPEHPSILGVSIGVLLGALSMAVIQLPVVLRHGFRYQPIIDFKHEGVKRVLILFAPVMIGMALSQYNLQMIPLQVASFAGPSAVTDIRAANRIMLLPFGLFAVAISTAAFPKLAQLISLGNTEEFRKTISKSIRAILFLSIPAAVGIFVLSYPLTCLLWGGGRYLIEDIGAASFTLSFFIWGLLALGTMQVINRSFYALQDTITPVVLQVLMVGSNALIGWMLIKFSDIKYAGIALSTSLTTTICALILFEVLRRRLKGLEGRAIVVTALKVTVASVLMGITMYGVASLRPLVSTVVQTDPQRNTVTTQQVRPSYGLFWRAPDLDGNKELSDIKDITVKKDTKRVAAQIGISGIAGMLVLLAALRLLKVEELSLITDRIGRRFRRRPPENQTQTAEPQ